MAVSHGTPTTAGGAASTSLSVPYPATINAGDVTFMRISAPNLGSGTVTTPSGWSLADNQHDSTTGAGHYLFWKVSDPADAGTNQAVTTSDTSRTWRYQMWQVSSVRTSPTPWANLLGGVSATGTSFTTGALTIYASNLSGLKYMMAVAQAGATGFTHSAEVANGFTSPTLDEFIESNGFMASLISAATSTSTSTFSDTMSASNRASWTIMDLVEAVLAPTGSLTLTGTAAWVVPSVTGALALSATATWTPGGGVAGAVTLAATAAWVAPAATGSLSLAGTANAKAAGAVTGSLTLGGTVTAKAAAGATGSLTLAGTVTAQASAAASGSLTLGGTAAGSAAPSIGGSLALDGTGAAAAPVAATGALILTGQAVAAAPVAASGAVTLGALAAWTVPAVAGSLTLSGGATGNGRATAHASIQLLGALAARAATTALGSLTLGGMPAEAEAVYVKGVGATTVGHAERASTSSVRSRSRGKVAIR